MKPPVKPFPEYKWRWATLECTEGLNAPPVFMGVLRVLASHEGVAPSDSAFIKALGVVQQETNTRVDLVRTPARNLIRNSGQYWKAPGLLKDTRGLIALTPLGKKVALGAVTAAELAVTVVKTLELPNKLIEEASVVKKWQKAGLVIRPLELILAILAGLMRRAGKAEAYITANELMEIVIPLAGSKASTSKCAEALMLFRQGKLSTAGWPNCVPGANDRRMAKEFLIFLAAYGLLTVHWTSDKYNDKCCLGALSASEVKQLAEVKVAGLSTIEALKAVKGSQIPATAERKRVLTEVLARPQQGRFRKDVLSAYKRRCLITKVTLPEVLEAAHVVPIRANGDDSVSNGICLRSDIHLLFDSGHLRIAANGALRLSDTTAMKENYGGKLPKKIILPEFLSQGAVRWRWRYQ